MVSGCKGNDLVLCQQFIKHELEGKLQRKGRVIILILSLLRPALNCLHQAAREGQGDSVLAYDPKKSKSSGGD